MAYNPVIYVHLHTAESVRKDQVTAFVADLHLRLSEGEVNKVLVHPD